MKVAEMYGVGGNLLNSIKSFCVDSKVYVKVRGEKNGWFKIK